MSENKPRISKEYDEHLRRLKELFASRILAFYDMQRCLNGIMETAVDGYHATKHEEWIDKLLQRAEELRTVHQKYREKLADSVNVICRS